MTRSVVSAAAVGAAMSAGGPPATGRAAFGLLWRASRPLSVGVIAWSVAGALTPPLVVGALGAVIGEVPGAIEHGMASAAGHRLILALIIAAVIYTFSLVLDPIGSALGTSARSLLTGRLQARVLGAVSAPVGVGHLEDGEVLDRLARAEGSLNGFFPGDAPVTWIGILAARASGVIGCAVLSFYAWWLGLGLLIMWIAVRRLILATIVRQATEFRVQATAMRRAWYFIGVGSKARDAKEVRVFGLGDFFAGRFQAEYRDAITSAVPGLRALHRRAALGWLIVLAGLAVAMSIIAVDAREHTISLRTLAILLPMLAVTMALGSISFDDITLAWTLAGIPDVDRLEAELAPSAQLAGHEDPTGRPVIELAFDNVHFRYPGGSVDVLSGLDLTLRAGTSTAIVGVNGAGKSTLVSLISRLRDPSSGRITVDGTDIRYFDARQWQRSVAIMTQEPARYPVSAYDNVAFGAIEHAGDRDGVHEAARLAGFADVAAALPAGWDTVLARELPGGVELSGGQWQRLALARALFATRHGARLLVLDEPTAALDIRSEAAFYGRFLEITAGLTTVVISHRFATVRRADTICVLDGGVITERGSHDELLALGGTYARMYRLQAARFGGAGRG